MQQQLEAGTDRGLPMGGDEAVGRGELLGEASHVASFAEEGDIDLDAVLAARTTQAPRRRARDA